MKQKPIDQRVDDALNSLDGIQRAEANPWFFARVNARLQKDESSYWAHIGSFLSKPGIALAGVSLILVLNVFLLLSNKEDNNAPLASQIELQYTGDSEPVIASNSSLDYENLVQP